MTKTFILLTLDSEGAPYSEIADILQDMGFQRGASGYDFVYDWGREVTIQQSLEFADRIQASLRGKRVGFRVESTENSNPES
jgi:hypothetical protein